MADAATHDHGHEDPRGFFTRWFMSTNHKDIGILYLFTSGIVGFIAVAFTVYMRMELMEPGVQYMCMEGASFTAQEDCTPNGHIWNVLITAHGILMMFFVLIPGAVRWVWQLLHALADRRAGHGIPASEQPVLLAVRCWLRLGRGLGPVAGRQWPAWLWCGLGALSATVNQRSRLLDGPRDLRGPRVGAPRPSWARSTSSPPS